MHIHSAAIHQSEQLHPRREATTRTVSVRPAVDTATTRGLFNLSTSYD